MPKEKVNITRGGKSPSRLAKLKRAEAELAMLDARAERPEIWLERIRAYKPDMDPAALIREIRDRRNKARDAYIAQRKAYAKMKVPAAYQYRFPSDFWKWLLNQADADNDCPTIEGVAQTRLGVFERVLVDVDDNDTESDYSADFYEPSSGSFHSLMYSHWMRDHTHFYSVDSPDLMWMISHMGYEFPAAPCDGTLYYEANLRLTTSSFVDADSAGLLLVDLLKEESPAGGNPPATWESYDSWLGQHAFTTTDYRSTVFPISGSMAVQAGNKARLWLGVSSLCSAEDGIAGTNGWSYLIVGWPDGETQPGVKYRIVH